MLMRTAFLALCLAAGGAHATESDGDASAAKGSPGQGGACSEGQCAKASACGAACSKTIAGKAAKQTCTRC
jgi:hypothetical protein